MFSQTPSSLLRIRDWDIARELDIASAQYVIEEETKREFEREKRDREFWRVMFGGKPDDDLVIDSVEGPNKPLLEDTLERSALGRM